MKHNIKITIILISMFIITQLIGLYVVGYYSNPGNILPFGLEPPTPTTQSDYYGFFSIILFAFVIAILIFMFLKKLKFEWVFRIWFLIVVTIAMIISLISVLSPVTQYYFIIALVISFAFGYLKVFGRDFLVHNFTELLIYPGIAAIFVPLLNFYTILVLLVIISIYDMWAVWHSGIMQKMAKYQIDKVRVFSGFFVPYLSKQMKSKVKKWKKTLTKSELRKKKMKVNVAILGGGDIVFPIITAGVIMNTSVISLPFGLKSFLGGLIPALFVILGAAIALIYLSVRSEKKKFYPAMPFITAGILVGLIVSWILF